MSQESRYKILFENIYITVQKQTQIIKNMRILRKTLFLTRKGNLTQLLDMTTKLIFFI